VSERVAPKTYFTTCTIASGGSLSAEIDGRGMRLAKVFMPAEWTSADITFAVASASGGTFNALYDDASTPAEVTLKAAAARTIAIDGLYNELTAMGYFKVRSGTAGSAVNQQAARTIGLLFVG